jgi:hypothetical protein
MTFDASHALRFVNKARAASGLPALAELPFAGAARVDERACVLARALHAEIGGSADPAWNERFVVRLGDRARARAVAAAVGQSCNDRGEVLLPEPLVRLAVGFDRGLLGSRSARYVAPGQLSFDELELTRSPPPPGGMRGRRTADPGGTDAARAARFSDRVGPCVTIPSRCSDADRRALRGRRGARRPAARHP